MRAFRMIFAFALPLEITSRNRSRSSPLSLTTNFLLTMSRPLVGYSRQFKNQGSRRDATTHFKSYKPLGPPTPGTASDAVTLGSNDASRRSRRHRTIHCRIHEWICATHVDVPWRAWQTTQDLCHHRAVNSATVINVALGRLASKRQRKRKAVSAFVPREEFIAIKDVVPIARR